MEVFPQSDTWSDEALMTLPEADGKFELVNGELVMGPAGFLHEILVIRLAAALENFVAKEGIGVVGGSNLGCRMKNGDLRCPDVSFIYAERVPRLSHERESFFRGAPDLVVEILSPSERLEKITLKARDYFDNGCRVCWILVPEKKTVIVLGSDGSQHSFSEESLLDGGEVLPGFVVSVSELFRTPSFRNPTP